MDEAQDNLLIDALCTFGPCIFVPLPLITCLVLRLLCSNSAGLFWAGDTAQTIAIGSSFRFNDLKSFLHRVEVRHRQIHEIDVLMYDL